jgi:hypothetical protein
MTKEEEIFIDRKCGLERSVSLLAVKLGDHRAACAVWDAVGTLLLGCREVGVQNEHLTALEQFLLREWPAP